jgi:hypothetical protein
MDMLIQQLRMEAKPGPVVLAMNRAMARFAPTLDANLTRIHQRIFEPQVHRMMESFFAATNRLLLVATNEMIGPITAIAELLGRAEERDAEWDQAWDEARGRLVKVTRRVLGSEELTPAEESSMKSKRSARAGSSRPRHVLGHRQ